MDTDVTAIEGRTVYVPADPAGLGATVKRALAELPDARSVAVTGGKLGTIAATRRWVDNLDGWVMVDRHYVERDGLHVRIERDGHAVTVRRVAQWVGPAAGPADAAEAMRIVRGVTTRYGVAPHGHPSTTGAAMLVRHWDETGQHWPACPPEVAELLIETSGQGRFEVFPAAAPERGIFPQVVRVDARFQYGALAATELPVGEPVEVVGELPDPYAPAWSLVRFTPADGLPVGILPVYSAGDPAENERKGWRWPTSGDHEGWVSGAELHLARRHGYRAEVVRSIVWPTKAKPLRSWAELLATRRAELAELPISPGAREGARWALRAILMLTIGAMHRYDRAQVVISGNTEGSPTGQSPTRTSVGSGSVLSRPEWSTTIYGLARARLAREMLAQSAPVLGCTLDGYYVGGEPVVAPDDGRVGRFRIEARGQWADPVRTVPELFAASKLLAEVEA